MELQTENNFVEMVYKPNTVRSNEYSGNEISDHPKTEAWFLYVTAFIVNLVIFVSGISLSWTSPVIPKLRGDENPFNHPVTATQEAWIAVFSPLGATIGPFAIGHLADRMGRRKSLITLATPMLIGYFLLTFGTKVELYYIARFLIGVGIGGAFAIVPIYLGEITESHNRGKFGVMIGFFITFGLFYPFAVGPHLKLFHYNISCTVPLILFMVCFTLFLPETPYYLAGIGDLGGAQIALTKLRRKSEEDIQLELLEVVNAVEEDRKHKTSLSDLFKNIALKRSLIIGLTLVILAQFDGINPILAFLKPIFEASDSNTLLSPNMCTAIIGCVEVASNGAAVLFVEKIGRKPLVYISSIGCLISLLALGTYFHLKNNEYDVSNILWIPVTTLILYNMFFSIGLGPLSISFIGEIFPSNVRGLAAACASSATFLCSCITMFSFSLLTERFGMTAPFWMYAFFCVVTIAFARFLMVETKGKTLAEIQSIMGNRITNS